jgi:D-aminoacyl-tRNA deacylase
MIAVIQRVSEASVKIEGQIKGQIGVGFLVLLGITHNDSEADVVWLAKKIVGMRLFGDAEGKMNLDLKAVNGTILLVSQFTLHANTKKGNRPSFIEAARPEQAIPLYEKMIEKLSAELGQNIETGTFGADMKVLLLNDGPVTIVIDSKMAV